jgi:transposase-like protein
VSRPCSVCLHPRREDAENLLRQGLSIRRSASAIGIGAAALHRHWRRHAANRHSISQADPVAVGNETTNPAQLAMPEKASPTRPYLSAATHSAGGGPFCWCARCQGRRSHYRV